MAVPGWPADLVPQGHEDFLVNCVKWLLDQGPPQLRQSPLRMFPLALAMYVESFISGAIEGVRSGYSTTRVNLGGSLEASQLETVQQALASEGARLVALAREIALVRGALAETIGLQ
ncbi:MAG: hypothetical protein F2923_05530 [Actinobacteria bacterium]|uniref:Unannotated protein n=1 Tax=freshwater metagenome TaxID=449393 RepID=A0A6J7GKY2_9ZZZZ|nr:hypothetical protein [Actinomycetota bacterium]MTB28084.1 hypothetical protein [Actinomycetota bacterium]